MSRNPWPKSARVTAPLMPPPLRSCAMCGICELCAACGRHIDVLLESVESLRAERDQLRALIDTAADLAVAEGAPE
jgi:hypothetical protein